MLPRDMRRVLRSLGFEDGRALARRAAQLQEQATKAKQQELLRRAIEKSLSIAREATKKKRA